MRDYPSNEQSLEQNSRSASGQQRATLQVYGLACVGAHKRGVPP